MPQSSIIQISFDQQWFSGDNPVPFFDADAITLDSEVAISVPSRPLFFGYPYSMDIPNTPPNPERIVSNVELLTQSGTDNGFEFNGEFRPDSSGLEVTGNLSDIEKVAVLSSFTILEGSLQIQGDTGQRIVTDNYVLNTFLLSSLGINDFGIKIPYEERSIQTLGNTISIPFFSIGRVGDARTTEISLGGNPRSLTINDGSESVTQSSLQINNISIPSIRDFSFINAKIKLNDDDQKELQITSEEITLGKTIFQINNVSSAFPVPFVRDNLQYEVYSKISLSLDVVGGFGGISSLNARFRPTSFNITTGRPDFTNQGIGPLYAMSKTGDKLLFTHSIDTNTDTHSYEIKTTSLSGNNYSLGHCTFTNNYDQNISFKLERNASFNRIILSGFTTTGELITEVFQIGNTNDETFIKTFEELSDEINERIEGTDWSGSVSFVVNNPDVINRTFTKWMRLFQTASVEIEEVIVSGNGGSLSNIGYNLPPINEAFSIEGKEYTLRNFCDIIKTFNILSPGLVDGYPISEADFLGIPDDWLDFEGIPSTLNHTSNTYSNGIWNHSFKGLNSGINENPISKYLYVYTNDWTGTRTWESIGLGPATESTMQDNCDYINNLINSVDGTRLGNYINCVPGLFYGELSNIAFTQIEPRTATWSVEAYSFISGNQSIPNIVSLVGGFSSSNILFPNIDMDFNNNILLLENTTIANVANLVSNLYTGVLEAMALNSSGSVASNNLIIFDNNQNLEESISFESDYTILIEESYQLSSFTIPSLINKINTDWQGRGFTATIDTGISNRPDAITSNLENFNINRDISIVDYDLIGEVSEFQSPEAPSSFVYLQYTLDWITDVSTGVDEQGIQVALGGYKSNGEFFINPSPNAFFEPGFNSLFDVSFTVLEAEEIYILVRTREDVDGTTFTSNPNDYNGLVRYSNGLPSELAGSAILNGSPFDSWIDDDWNSGVSPAAFIVPSGANVITLFADDTNISDSIQVRINNFPEELDEFAFLALNRTNLNASMSDSRQGRVFGLVLDNRGIWDILIGPEAEIQRVADGEFDYLNFSFNHSTIDSDEAYDFEIFNTDDLDDQILNSIQLIPVPGYPKVSVLRIETGVRDYLSASRSGSSLNSVDGCSVDIDIIAEGRESGAQGIARITIFADYTCVFDIGLCDFFWNLTDPPDPVPPSNITNEITISYNDYIDCERLAAQSDGDNLRLPIPILVTADKIPVFENGNALLLIKGSYSASVEGFFFPSRSSFGSIQDTSCNSVTDNASLSDTINREAIYINGQETAIVDPILISEIINGTEPYMYIKPQFQFPFIDKEFECGANEVVIAAIGYQFKDWTSNVTTRLDDIFIGVNALVSNSTFSAPEIEFCYKYYYRRES